MALERALSSAACVSDNAVATRAVRPDPRAMSTWAPVLGGLSKSSVVDVALGARLDIGDIRRNGLATSSEEAESRPVPEFRGAPE